MASSWALNCRATRDCRTRSMVREATSMGSTVNYFRNFEIPGAGLRRVGDGFGVTERRNRSVGAQSGFRVGLIEYLRHWFDTAGVDFVEAGHVLQNPVELGLKAADLVVAELEIGQFGDVAHLFFGELHAKAFLRDALYMPRRTGSAMDSASSLGTDGAACSARCGPRR